GFGGSAEAFPFYASEQGPASRSLSLAVLFASYFPAQNWPGKSLRSGFRQCFRTAQGSKRSSGFYAGK
ncbi:MAG: hypothetical protein ACRD45_05005, partial [Bryobacteraceae bacterium]